MIATKGSFSLAGSGANEPDRCVVSNLTAKHWYRQKVVINPTIQPLPTAETLEEWVMEISRDYLKKNEQNETLLLQIRYDSNAPGND